MVPNDSWSHEEMWYTLFDNGGGFYDWTADFGSFTFKSGDDMEGGLVNGERVSMDWVLSEFSWAIFQIA